MKPQLVNSSDQRILSGTMSCFLAVIGWLVVILTWAWVLTRPHGTFHDQGGLVLTFVVFPLTLGAWFVGGPIALALGGRAIKRLGQAEETSSGRRIARMGVFLSRLMFWGGVAWLLITILLSFI